MQNQELSIPLSAIEENKWLTPMVLPIIPVRIDAITAIAKTTKPALPQNLETTKKTGVPSLPENWERFSIYPSQPSHPSGWDKDATAASSM